MTTLIIAGVDKESGKTVVALGIALNHAGKIEYIKPIRGHLIKEDQLVFERDARLIKQVLGLEGSDSDISPIDLDPGQAIDVEGLVERIIALEAGSDLLLVEMGRTAEEGMSQETSAFHIAAALDVGIILVSDADPSHLDTILLQRAYAEANGVTIKGVIVNNDTDGQLAGLLRDNDIPVLGVVPFEPSLSWFRVSEVLEEVGGKCIAGSAGLDRVVENVVIGAMTAESALPLLRRIPRKAVITGGDRSDLQLAALTTDTSCLILTGGLPPTSHVMATAHEQGIPVIVMEGHTYSVTERFERLESRINPLDERVIGTIKDLIGDGVDLEQVLG
jgi:BioD-like phosphotransacetylase family protein